LSGALRLHGGDARGRHLAAPRGIRPTQGMVVEAIFNMLGAEVIGAAVIDLFAGSGALGLEALSRGAARATFVDESDESVRAIRRNLETLGYQETGFVVRSDVPRWLHSHPAEVAKARIVLLDPPYRDPVLSAALTELDKLVGEGAIVVAERGTRDPLPELARLELTRERRYGDTSVTIARA
jgi:16S rRNA (guanine966-N2)-methyltransferase